MKLSQLVLACAALAAGLSCGGDRDPRQGGVVLEVSPHPVVFAQYWFGAAPPVAPAQSSTPTPSPTPEPPHPSKYMAEPMLRVNETQGVGGTIRTIEWRLLDPQGRPISHVPLDVNCSRRFLLEPRPPRLIPGGTFERCLPCMAQPLISEPHSFEVTVTVDFDGGETTRSQVSIPVVFEKNP